MAEIGDAPVALLIRVKELTVPHPTSLKTNCTICKEPCWISTTTLDESRRLGVTQYWCNVCVLEQLGEEELGAITQIAKGRQVDA